MSEKDFVESERRWWAKQAHFFSNKGKPERERWVVGEFLTHLSVSYSEDDLIAYSQDGDVDIGFRNARFQVKELVTPGMRRGAEIKQLWKQAESATNVEDLIGYLTSYDVPAFAQAYDLICSEAAAQASKYIPSRLDLLVYVTRTHASPIRVEEVVTDHLAAIGWRSISCLMGCKAVVLYASEAAPLELRAAQILN